MSLGNIFDAEARERAEEEEAKRRLEEKLGREVSDYDLYSLGAHLEAAEREKEQTKAEASAPPPTKSPWEPGAFPAQTANLTPPPAPTKPLGIGCKVIMLGVLALFGLLVAWGGAKFFMSERTYNRWSPFTPRPTKGAFPETVAGFRRSDDPDYSSSYSSICNCKHFQAYYKNSDATIDYTLEGFASPEEAQKGLAKKDFVGGFGEILSQTATRFTYVRKDMRGAIVALALGKDVVILKSMRNAAVTDFENNLPYAAFGVEQPPAHDAAELADKPIPALAVLEDLNRDPAAAKAKYENRYFFFSGTVSEVGSNVTTTQVRVTPTPAKSSTSYSSRRRGGVGRLVKSLTSTSRPASTPYTRTEKTTTSYIVLTLTDANDETKYVTLRVVFDQSNTEKVKQLKAGDTIFFRGKVNLGGAEPTVTDARLDTEQ